MFSNYGTSYCKYIKHIRTCSLKTHLVGYVANTKTIKMFFWDELLTLSFFNEISQSSVL